MANETTLPVRGYRCQRCECETYSRGEARVATGFLGRLFNLESGRFLTVSCNRCGYTEFFKRDSTAVGNLLDFLGG